MPHVVPIKDKKFIRPVTVNYVRLCALEVSILIFRDKRNLLCVSFALFLSESRYFRNITVFFLICSKGIWRFSNISEKNWHKEFWKKIKKIWNHLKFMTSFCMWRHNWHVLITKINTYMYLVIHNDYFWRYLMRLKTVSLLFLAHIVWWTNTTIIFHLLLR